MENDGYVAYCYCSWKGEWYISAELAQSEATWYHLDNHTPVPKQRKKTSTIVLSVKDMIIDEPT